MVVKDLMGHHAMGGRWGQNKHHPEGHMISWMVDGIDRCTINKYFLGVCCKFFIFLTIRNVPGNKANLKIASFVTHSIVNDGFHSIAMMHCGRQVADESGQKDIIGCSEAMGMKEDLSFGEPIIEGGVPFKLPKEKNGANTDMNMDHVVIVIGS